MRQAPLEMVIDTRELQRMRIRGDGRVQLSYGITRIASRECGGTRVRGSQAPDIGIVTVRDQ